MDQAAGAKRSGPHTNYQEEMVQYIHNASILAQTKLEVMQHTVSKSPRVSTNAHRIQIASLLDSGSEVMLLRQS